VLSNALLVVMLGIGNFIRLYSLRFDQVTDLVTAQAIWIGCNALIAQIFAN
jgi:hypothetical protein